MRRQKKQAEARARRLRSNVRDRFTGKTTALTVMLKELDRVNELTAFTQEKEALL